jgi:hypothetical protein
MSDVTREEVDAKLAAVEARIEARLANLEMLVRTGFAELRSDMRAEMAELRVEMHKNTANLIKWGVALAIAVVGLNVGLITLVSRVH